MKIKSILSSPFPSKLAVLLLASAIAVPAYAQEAQPADNSQSSPPSATQEQAPPHTPTGIGQSNEGFWGHMNPFSRKKWVKRQIDPIRDQLGELDEVSAKNAKDIQEVDGRAQAGIHRAQSSADAANQSASTAAVQAQQAGSTAQNAMNHVDALNATVNKLDDYAEKDDVDIVFRGGQPVLSPAARKSLDDLASKVNGQAGYLIEVEAHSPAAGAAGIRSSQRLAEAVKRYLVTQHEVPVYRLHTVALGNAHGTPGDENDKPIHTSSVHVRLMENSLAAQVTAPRRGDSSISGTERP